MALPRAARSCRARWCSRRSRSWRAGSRPRRAGSRGGSCSTAWRAPATSARRCPATGSTSSSTAVKTDDPARRAYQAESHVGGERRALVEFEGRAVVLEDLDSRERMERAFGRLRGTRPGARRADAARMRAVAATDAAVTGVGVVTALGVGAAATWEGLLLGRDGARTVPEDGGPREIGRAATIDEPWLRTTVPEAQEAQAKFLNPSGQLAVTAAAEAAAAGGLAGRGDDGGRPRVLPRAGRLDAVLVHALPRRRSRRPRTASRSPRRARRSTRPRSAS